MTDIRTFNSENMTAGDAAVSGLLNGIVGGAAMAAYLLIALGIGGESPAGGAASPLAGAVSHLAMSAIYGVVFALIWRLIARRTPGRGLAMLGGLIYAGILFAAAEFVLLPAANSPMLDIPVHFGIAHVIYGLVLGLLTRRS